MTVTIDTSASELAARRGSPAFYCDGAQIRAHCRPLATVVTITGEIDALNIERVTEYTRRFVLTGNPLVLDLSGLSSFAAPAVSLLYALDEECQAAGVEWALVPGGPVVELLPYSDETMFTTVASVHEALHHFADGILRRRQLMLTLIRKTA